MIIYKVSDINVSSHIFSRPFLLYMMRGQYTRWGKSEFR